MNWGVVTTDASGDAPEDEPATKPGIMRVMQLLEFQAKELLSRFDIAVPRGRVADNPDEALRISRRLGFDRFAIKAQVQAGKRKAAGGVRFAASPDGVRATTELLVGQPLVTAETGPAGERVRWVLVEEAIEAAEHLYVAVSLDRQRGVLTVLGARPGGDDIEERAAANPALIVREPARLSQLGADADCKGFATRLGLPGDAVAGFATIVANLLRAAVRLDATLIEINPLALTSDGRFVALDAKMTVDDNALIRHPALAALRAATQIEEGDPEELAADRHHLNYQRFDGDIGVCVNGAGLALATHDMLVDAGGRPANFMDIRTTASSLDVAYGFDLVLANPGVRAILVNVHGGGMQRCDTIAEGVGIAMRRNGRQVPLVVRLAGNNAEFARTRLQSYGIAFEDAADMLEAVRLTVAKAAPQPA